MIFNKIGISDPKTGVLGAILTPPPIFKKYDKMIIKKLAFTLPLSSVETLHIVGFIFRRGPSHPP